MRGRTRGELGTLLLLLLAAAQPASAQPAGEFAPGKLSFLIKVRGETTSYRELALTVMPESTLRLEIPGNPAPGPYEMSTAAGIVEPDAPGRWSWRSPPHAGLHPLRVRRVDTGETMRFNVFVLVPRSRVEKGRFNGYRIDAYPTVPLKGLEIYRPPRGFIEVTEENLNTAVSPHFTLRQFLCKQSGGYPKYVVLRERLLLKLELLLEQVNRAGIRCDTFHVMSGYRTPYYNRAIGNVKYSRHVYGGAADIFVDEQPQDGVMDDLNKDGKIDIHDAGVLYDLIDRLYGTELYQPYVGGLGRYRTTSAHGPFVHVDVRGFRARWGD